MVDFKSAHTKNGHNIWNLESLNPQEDPTNYGSVHTSSEGGYYIDFDRSNLGL